MKSFQKRGQGISKDCPVLQVFENIPVVGHAISLVHAVNGNIDQANRAALRGTFGIIPVVGQVAAVCSIAECVQQKKLEEGFIKEKLNLRIEEIGCLLISIRRFGNWFTLQHMTLERMVTIFKTPSMSMQDHG